uniref:Uncharacterized protein n=1 Tax=Rhizophora mucronata TaxID=61149 RepID=A0A2P2QX69_RHIMU
MRTSINLLLDHSALVSLISILVQCSCQISFLSIETRDRLVRSTYGRHLSNSFFKPLC